MSASDRLLGASGPNRSALGRVLRLIPFDEPVQLAITVVVVLLALWLVLYPLGWLIWAMFHKGAPGASGDWTTENLKVLLDAEYWQLVGRSLIVGVGTTLLATFIGVPLAWVTVKTDMPGKRFVEIIAILPFFTSTFIGALAWIFLGNPTNGLLKLWLGIPINVYSMGGIIWVTGLYMAPYIYLFASAALRNMDTSYEEASFMAGAGLFRTLTRVTFPLIFPALMSGMSLVLVISLDIFGVAAILGFPARISVLATSVFVNASLVPPAFGKAAVEGLTLIIIAALLLFLQNRYLSKRSYTVVSGRGFRVKLYSLGHWTPVVVAGCCLYLLIAVLLPLLVLIKASFQVYPTPYFRAFTLANWGAFFGNDEVVKALLRSFYLSTFGATLTVIFTAVVAYIVHRTRVPGRSLLEYIVAIPIGTPGIVMGLGIMWAYITWPLWGTVWILVLAYMTLFMPYGVRAMGATLVQIHPELEESSRVHRGSWLMTFRRIVLPLLRSGVYSTWILLFIIFIREISTAVLLTSVNTQVFPVLIFQEWMAGSFNVMSAGALLLSLIIFAVVALFRSIFKVDVVPAYR
jgi:iron(III) transport system permease protein